MCDCSQILGTGMAYELITQNKSADVIIGPPCTTSALFAGAAAAFFNIPIVIWGAATATAFSNQTLYPSLINLNAYNYQTALALRGVLQQAIAPI